MRESAPSRLHARLLRLVLAGLAVVCFCVGWVAIWVPGLPTTVFWLASAYLATRSCPVLRDWVYRRGAVGRSVEMMLEHRALTRAGKRRALCGMSLGVSASLGALVWLGLAGPGLVVAILVGAGVGAASILFGLRTWAEGESEGEGPPGDCKVDNPPASAEPYSVKRV